MSGLDREDLIEACRELYQTAAGDFMLPPLLRDVTDIEAESKHTYYALTKSRCVRFTVEFDKAYVDANSFPLSRLPLNFKCELCDLDFEETPVALSESESLALIRAFFLGAKAPINVELNPLTRRIKLSIQLSSSFFVDCGYLSWEDCNLSPKAISQKVSRSLYEKSKDFFSSADDGLNVWTARAAQEFFDEAKPPAEAYWPHETHHAAATQAAGQRHAPFDVPPVEAVRPNQADALVPALVITSGRSIADVSVAVASRITVTPRRHYLHGGIAAILVLTSGAAMSRLSLFSNSIGPATNTAVAVDPPPAKAAAVVAAREAPEPAPQRISEPEPPSEIKTTTLSPIPTMPQPECATPPVAEPPPRSVTTKPLMALAHGSTIASKAESQMRRTAHGKTAHHRSQRRHSDPLVAVGRAATKLVTGVVDNLRRIPNHLSALIQ
jgi:hypothetical protein